MGYLDEEPAAEKVWGMVARAAIGLVAALVVGGLVSGGFGYFGQSRVPTEIELESQLLNDSNFGELYVVLKEEFPEDYGRFKTEMISVVQRGGDSSEGFDMGRRFIRQFLVAHRSEFTRSPEAELLRARDLNIRTIELLAGESDELCAHFAMSGLRQDDRPSSRTLKRMAQAGVAQLRAIAAGRDNPTPRDEPTEQDSNQFIASLSSAGLTDAEIDMFLAGGPALEAQPIDRQCEMGLALYRGLADVPPAASARLSAALLIPPT